MSTIGIWITILCAIGAVTVQFDVASASELMNFERFEVKNFKIL